MQGEGSSIARDQLANVTLIIKDKTFKISGLDGDNGGTFSLDSAKEPKQMDIHPDSGDNMPAIYEIGADTFRVCYGMDGGARPASFSSTADSGPLMITYKKKKAANE